MEDGVFEDVDELGSELLEGAVHVGQFFRGEGLGGERTDFGVEKVDEEDREGVGGEGLDGKEKGVLHDPDGRGDKGEMPERRSAGSCDLELPTV